MSDQNLHARRHLTCVFYALFGVVLAFAWQVLHVEVRCAGNWTALFDTGELFPSPPWLANETIYVYARSTGYDGQFYHYIAHDPLLQKGTIRYLDSPALRYRRILVPALAFLLAGGRQSRIDAAYDFVILSAVLLGTYWLSVLSVRNGQPPALGLLFVLLPAVILSVETMTVDIVLAALTLAYCLTAGRFSIRLAIVVALAPLARETGCVFLLASLGDAVFRRKWRDATLFALCGLPWLAWQLYVYMKIGPEAYPLDGLPLQETLHAFFVSAQGIPQLGVPGLENWFHCFQIAGELLAILLAVRLGVKGRLGPVEIACGVFALTAVGLQRQDVWFNFHAHGRLLTPLLATLALRAMDGRSRIYLLPLALVLPRFLWHLVNGAAAMLSIS